MLSQRINILHDVFQHLCKSLCNQQCIFLYQNIAYRKTGGGNGRGNSHDLKIFEKTGGKPGGNGTIRNIDTILQKAPISRVRFSKGCQSDDIGHVFRLLHLRTNVVLSEKYNGTRCWECSAYGYIPLHCVEISKLSFHERYSHASFWSNVAVNACTYSW